MKKLITLFLLFQSLVMQGQDMSKMIFVDFDTAINYLRSINFDTSKDTISKHISASNLLLLDTSYISQLEKYEDYAVKLFRDTHGAELVPEHYRKSIPVQSKDIKDYFRNRELFLRMMSWFIVGDKEIYRTYVDDVYVKGNSKAVFTIWGNRWSKSFRISIKGNELIIELISSSIV